MYPICDVSDAEMAFGGIKGKMPPMDKIPEEFSSPRNKWVRLFSDWFYCGLKKLELKPKEGVDQTKALRHIKTIMGSWEPKQEHKEAAVAFLLSEWFEDATWERAK